MNGQTDNYTGRQIDLELFQTVVSPDRLTPVSVSMSQGVPKKVTGLQKLVQRYTIALLSTFGGVYFDKTFGTDFIQKMANGGSRNSSRISAIFSFASSPFLSSAAKTDRNFTGL
jgi:hypothetical protein